MLYLDKTGKTMEVDIIGHDAFVKLFPGMLLVDAFGVDPENSFDLHVFRTRSGAKASDIRSLSNIPRENHTYLHFWYN